MSYFSLEGVLKYAEITYNIDKILENERRILSASDHEDFRDYLDITALNKIFTADALHSRKPNEASKSNTSSNFDPTNWTTPSGISCSLSEVPILEDFEILNTWSVVHDPPRTGISGWIYKESFHLTESCRNVPDGTSEVRFRVWQRVQVHSKDFERARKIYDSFVSHVAKHHAYNLDFINSALSGLPFRVQLIYENQVLEDHGYAGINLRDQHCMEPSYWTQIRIQPSSSKVKTLVDGSIDYVNANTSEGIKIDDENIVEHFPYADINDGEEFLLPEDWAVLRGFNFVVGEHTDSIGWQYAESYWQRDFHGNLLSTGKTEESSRTDESNFPQHDWYPEQRVLKEDYMETKRHSIEKLKGTDYVIENISSYQDAQTIDSDGARVVPESIVVKVPIEPENSDKPKKSKSGEPVEIPTKDVFYYKMAVRRRLWCRVLCPKESFVVNYHVFNVFQAKHLRGTIYSGTLTKLGHFRKSWKERRFELIDNQLSYYSGNQLKGRMSIMDCKVNNVSDLPQSRWAMSIKAIDTIAIGDRDDIFVAQQVNLDGFNATFDELGSFRETLFLASQGQGSWQSSQSKSSLSHIQVPVPVVSDKKITPIQRTTSTKLSEVTQDETAEPNSPATEGLVTENSDPTNVDAATDGSNEVKPVEPLSSSSTHNITEIEDNASTSPCDTNSNGTTLTSAEHEQVAVAAENVDIVSSTTIENTNSAKSESDVTPNVESNCPPDANTTSMSSDRVDATNQSTKSEHTTDNSFLTSTTARQLTVSEIQHHSRPSLTRSVSNNELHKVSSQGQSKAQGNYRNSAMTQASSVTSRSVRGVSRRRSSGMLSFISSEAGGQETPDLTLYAYTSSARTKWIDVLRHQIALSSQRFIFDVEGSPLFAPTIPTEVVDDTSDTNRVSTVGTTSDSKQKSRSSKHGTFMKDMILEYEEHEYYHDLKPKATSKVDTDTHTIEHELTNEATHEAEGNHERISHKKSVISGVWSFFHSKKFRKSKNHSSSNLDADQDDFDFGESEDENDYSRRSVSFFGISSMLRESLAHGRAHENSILEVAEDDDDNSPIGLKIKELASLGIHACRSILEGILLKKKYINEARFRTRFVWLTDEVGREWRLYWSKDETKPTDLSSCKFIQMSNISICEEGLPKQKVVGRSDFVLISDQDRLKCLSIWLLSRLFMKGIDVILPDVETLQEWKRCIEDFRIHHYHN